MHRVELKDIYPTKEQQEYFVVPNAPCGVESRIQGLIDDETILFLMHRVELKVPCIVLSFLVLSSS